MCDLDVARSELFSEQDIAFEKDKVIGKFCYRDEEGNVLYSSPNLILEGAREIIRDAIFHKDEDSTITKIMFGDLGKDSNTPTNELVNVPEPTESDVSLVRVVGEKIIPSDRITKIGIIRNARGEIEDTELLGRPGIRYSVMLEEGDLVTDDIIMRFILEIGLATSKGKLFSRKTHPVIIKTRGFKLELVWEILF